MMLNPFTIAIATALALRTFSCQVPSGTGLDKGAKELEKEWRTSTRGPCHVRQSVPLGKSCSPLKDSSELHAIREAPQAMMRTPASDPVILIGALRNRMIRLDVPSVVVGANAQTIGLRTAPPLCDGNWRGYACASRPEFSRPLKDVPSFPWVIGYPNTNGPNSTNCGACYLLSYTRAPGDVQAHTVTVVENSGQDGIATLCPAQYQNLTGITGPEPRDPPQAVLTRLSNSICGL
ncbi:hypothetical protein NMY22_g14311 [Coprinellus aureogranulatus]|nr:hypothetical protein NMY22_g14311 [Coprinellus aureogranulatus]